MRLITTLIQPFNDLADRQPFIHAPMKNLEYDRSFRL
jgi:hypothetical protein